MIVDSPPPTYITCPPGPAYLGVTDLADHNIARPADPEKAVEQHAHLVSWMEEAGCRIIRLSELQGHPNSVFTKDTALSTRHGYIRLRMGLWSRMGEEAWMAEALAQEGIPCIGQITEPGTAEGGDIILAGQAAFLGHSSRTNAEGIRQLSRLLEAMEYDVRTATVPAPFLHLGGAMTLVSPGTLLCVGGLFTDDFLRGFRRIEVPHTGFISGNVIPVGNHRVVAEKENRPALRALRQSGYSVFPVELSEFIKGTGGPNCLTLEV